MIIERQVKELGNEFIKLEGEKKRLLFGIELYVKLLNPPIGKRINLTDNFLKDISV